MATRYERIIERLASLPAENRHICNVSRCACKGCCGQVGAKRITQRELDIYNSGEMKENARGR